ncbi:hypothetical protein ACLOJK_032799 [Asimina triloba]
MLHAHPSPRQKARKLDCASFADCYAYAGCSRWPVATHAIHEGAAQPSPLSPPLPTTFFVPKPTLLHFGDPVY